MTFWACLRSSVRVSRKLISMPMTSPIQEMMMPGMRPKMMPLTVRKGMDGRPMALTKAIMNTLMPMA